MEKESVQNIKALGMEYWKTRGAMFDCSGCVQISGDVSDLEEKCDQMELEEQLDEQVSNEEYLGPRPPSPSTEV